MHFLKASQRLLQKQDNIKRCDMIPLPLGSAVRTVPYHTVFDDFPNPFSNPLTEGGGLYLEDKKISLSLEQETYKGKAVRQKVVRNSFPIEVKHYL